MKDVIVFDRRLIAYLQICHWQCYIDYSPYFWLWSSSLVEFCGRGHLSRLVSSRSVCADRSPTVFCSAITQFCCSEVERVWGSREGFCKEKNESEEKVWENRKRVSAPVVNFLHQLLYFLLKPITLNIQYENTSLNF